MYQRSNVATDPRLQANLQPQSTTYQPGERQAVNRGTQSWSALDAIGYLVLRNVQRNSDAESCKIIWQARGHMRPKDIGSTTYASMQVEYHGRSLQTEELHFSAVLEIFDLYMRVVKHSEARLQQMLYENARLGHELAAAMIIVHCHEGKIYVQRHPRNLHHRSTVTDLSESQQLVPRPIARAVDSSKPPVREPLPVPFAKWGILEAIAYELMVRVLNYSTRQIAAIIHFQPTMRVAKHTYMPATVEYNGTFVNTPTTYHANVVELVCKVLERVPDSRARVNETFRGDSITRHLVASAGVCVAGLLMDATILSPAQIQRTDHMRSNIQDHHKRSIDSSQSLREKSKNNEADPSIAHWSVLDLLAYQLMSSVLHYTLQQIISSGFDRAEILASVYERKHILERKTASPYNVAGTELTVPALSFQEINEIVNKFHASSTIATRLALSDVFNGKGLRMFSQVSAPQDGALQVYLEIRRPADLHRLSKPSIFSQNTAQQFAETNKTVMAPRYLENELKVQSTISSDLSSPVTAGMREIRPAYARIIETWDVLDVIAFLVLHKYAKYTADQIGKVMMTEVTDIELLVGSSEYLSFYHSSMWPTRQIIYQGRTGTTSKMLSAHIEQLTSLYMKDDSVAMLHHFLEVTEKEDYERAAIQLYCETYPKFTAVMQESQKKSIGSSNGDSNKAIPRASSVSSSGVEEGTGVARKDSLEPATSAGIPPKREPVAGQKRKLDVEDSQAERGRKPKTWSMLHNMQKKSTREAAPQLDDLDLVPTRQTAAAAIKKEDLPAVIPPETDQVHKRPTNDEGFAHQQAKKIRKVGRDLVPDSSRSIPNVSSQHGTQTVKIEVKQEAEVESLSEPKTEPVEGPVADTEDFQFVLSSDGEDDPNDDNRRIVRTRADESDDDEDDAMQFTLTSLSDDRIEMTDSPSHVDIPHEPDKTNENPNEVKSSTEPRSSITALTTSHENGVVSVPQLTAASWAAMLQGQGIQDSMLYKPMFEAFLQSQLSLPSTTSKQGLIDALLTAITEDPAGVTRSQFTGYLHTYIELSGSSNHRDFLAATYPESTLATRYAKVFSE